MLRTTQQNTTRTRVFVRQAGRQAGTQAGTQADSLDNRWFSLFLSLFSLLSISQHFTSITFSTCNRLTNHLIRSTVLITEYHLVWVAFFTICSYPFLSCSLHFLPLEYIYGGGRIANCHRLFLTLLQNSKLPPLNQYDLPTQQSKCQQFVNSIHFIQMNGEVFLILIS